MLLWALCEKRCPCLPQTGKHLPRPRLGFLTPFTPSARPLFRSQTVQPYSSPLLSLDPWPNLKILRALETHRRGACWNTGLKQLWGRRREREWGAWLFLRESPSPVPGGRKSPPGLALSAPLDCRPRRPPPLPRAKAQGAYLPASGYGRGRVREVIAAICSHLLSSSSPQPGGGAEARANTTSYAHPKHRGRGGGGGGGSWGVTPEPATCGGRRNSPAGVTLHYYGISMFRFC